MAQELENVWLLPKYRLINLSEFSCQSKSNCWIFPVKTQMQINLFDFTCLKHKIDLCIVWFNLWYKMNFQWICVLTREINLVNICRLLIIFFSKSNLLSDTKSRKLILIFVLTGKIKELICIWVLTGKSLAKRIQI